MVDFWDRNDIMMCNIPLHDRNIQGTGLERPRSTDSALWRIYCRGWASNSPGSFKTAPALPPSKANPLAHGWSLQVNPSPLKYDVCHTTYLWHTHIFVSYHCLGCILSEMRVQIVVTKKVTITLDSHLLAALEGRWPGVVQF